MSDLADQLARALEDAERIHERCRRGLVRVDEASLEARAIDERVAELLPQGSDAFRVFDAFRRSRSEWWARTLSGYVAAQNCVHFEARVKLLRELLGDIDPSFPRGEARPKMQIVPGITPAGRDRWSIVLGHLMELGGDDIVKAINRAGLKVDWSLSAKEDYSHSTRRRAYLPRIQVAYDALPFEAKGAILEALASEVIVLHTNGAALQENLGPDASVGRALPTTIASKANEQGSNAPPGRDPKHRRHDGVTEINGTGGASAFVELKGPVFISHDSNEAPLAKYLAKWIESRVPRTQCFCSTRPSDLPPGTDWYHEVIEAARESSITILLLSHDSLANSWVQFEAGLTLGARPWGGSEGNRQTLGGIVPAIYGGVSTEQIPSTMRRFQALRLDDQESFDSFVRTHLLGGCEPISAQMFTEFQAGLDDRTRRLLQYGRLGLLVAGRVDTEHYPSQMLEGARGEIHLASQSAVGQLIAVRLRAVPRRGPTWKCGAKLVRFSSGTNERVFEFHAGVHHGLASWTIYPTMGTNVFANVPAYLNTEQELRMELWLTMDLHMVYCVGTDSRGHREILRSDRGEEYWRVSSRDWSELRIAAWSDDGEPFRVEILDIEVDRVMTPGSEVTADGKTQSQ